jgi:hypothetical protein
MTTVTRRIELEADDAGFSQIEIRGSGTTGYLWFVEKASGVRVYELPPTRALRRRVEAADRAGVCGATFPERYLVEGYGTFAFVLRRPWDMGGESPEIVEVAVWNKVPDHGIKGSTPASQAHADLLVGLGFPKSVVEEAVRAGENGLLDLQPSMRQLA